MSTTYEKLAARYGEHDVVLITWSFVNAYGSTDPRFRQAAFCLDVETAQPKVTHQAGRMAERTDLKSYDELPEALVVALLAIKGSLHALRRNPEVGGGNAFLSAGQALELGNWGDKPQPFKAIPIEVTTNADEDALRKLGLIP